MAARHGERPPAVGTLLWMDAEARFVGLLQEPESPTDLDVPCLALAACFTGEVDEAVTLAQLDDLAARVGGPDLQALRAVLFEELGLAGDEIDYYDPANSFLDRVLARRRGIPITLAVVVIEVARRVGLGLEPVGMPGHFLVGVPAGAGTDRRLLDPFRRGTLLDVAGAHAIFERVSGAGATFDPQWLAPVDPHDVLARMLANLEGCYRRRGDAARAALALWLRAKVPGVGHRDRRRAAQGLAGLGQFDQAADVLEELASDLPSASSSLQTVARQLRARLN